MSSKLIEIARGKSISKRKGQIIPAPEDSVNTLTRACLADAVHKAAHLSRAEAARFVEEVLGEVVDVLVSGEEVKLSSFGAFQIRNKNERLGRNPKTGEDAKISKRRVVVFKPSNVLRARINKSSTPED